MTPWLVGAIALLSPSVLGGWTEAAAPSTAPRQFVVEGRVVDAATSAPLPDVRVLLTRAGSPTEERPRGQQTAADGRFRFEQVEAGGYVLSVSTVGYAFVSRGLTVGPGLVPLVIPLAEGTGAYTETVRVSADPRRSIEPGVASAAHLGSAALQDLRGVTTDDPMRAVHALPGVATGDDFQAVFSMRGSAFRHLGVVVDGVPAPRLLHVVQASGNDGSIAMINTDVLEAASLLAGPHARRDGEWLGPTMSFSPREGSRDRAGVRAAVSGTSASMVAEGPLGGSGRGAWLVSARKSYLDWLIRQLEPDIDSTIGFADALGKFVYDLTSRQQLQVLVIGGDAVYRESESEGVNSLARATSGSTLATVSWRRATGGFATMSRIAFLGSEFRNTGPLGQELARGYTQTVRARADVMHAIGAAWTLEGGLAWERYRMNEIRRRFRRAGDLVVPAEWRDVAPQGSAGSGWIQAARRSGSAGVALGTRVSAGDGYPGIHLQPWALVERTFSRITIRAGLGRSVQRGDPLLVPAAGETLRPERAIDVEAGVETRLGPALELRVSAFRRADRNLLRLAAEDRLEESSGRWLAAPAFPVFRSTLDGTSRGLDVALARRVGSATGWIGYTWARTTMRDRVTGERFDGDFDQLHTFNAAGTWRVAHHSTVGAKLRVGSNVPLVGYFREADGGVWLGAGRNEVRLPAYARLDLRITRTFVSPRRRLTLFAEVMNVLARGNVGQAAASIRPTLEVRNHAERLLPFVPSAGLLIEF